MRHTLLRSLRTTPVMILLALGAVYGLTTAEAAILQQPEPTVFHACYVPLTGTVYRVGMPDTRATCASTSHVAFSWTDGAGAIRDGDAAGGDLAGSYPTPRVAGLQGRPLAADPPAAGELLAWNGTAWAPAAAPSGLSSPNGQYALSMTDAGIVFTGPSGEIRLDGDGIALLATGPGSSVTLSDAVGSEISTGPKLTIKSAGILDLSGASFVDVNGGMVRLNGCQPLALVGTSFVVAPYDGGVAPVQMGSATVCAGP